MKICDLHCHSRFSDGTATPRELVDLACEKGLAALALTDHNTMDGLAPFAEAAEGRIEYCGGCEFSTDSNGRELHLLGLFLDPNHSGMLQNALTQQLERKEMSNRMTVERLTQDGYPVSYEEFISLYGTGSKNRTHIARYLIKKGVLHTVSEAMEGILSAKAGYYTAPKKLDFFEMIRMIRAQGGVAVWAHPMLQRSGEEMTQNDCEAILRQATECGLDGAEVYYSTYTEEDTTFMKKMCEKYGLIESGGSDFHGETKPNLEIGSGYGNLRVPYSCYEQLKKRATERNSETNGGNRL